MYNNLILNTDSYKLSHYRMYPEETETIYSYFEAREGAKYNEIVFFGLQYILQHHLAGMRVAPRDIDEAEKIVDAHMGPGVFNREGWEIILNEYDGFLPVKIQAVPEGTVCKPGDVLFTIENYGGKRLAWLTSYLETLLVQVWYPMTVASLSYNTKQRIKKILVETTGSDNGLEFMLHDFGCRGATTLESAAIGGTAHLVNFVGTDTVPALMFAKSYYGADTASLGFSVAAAEHSVMTSWGRTGEAEMFARLMDQYPTGILALPIDSYDYIHFIAEIVPTFREKILNRNGKIVFRPDSLSKFHNTPEEEVRWILESLYETFGGIVNDKGYKVLDPNIGVLWGDGIDPDGIIRILEMAADAGYAASNLVFGMGGGLLQKVNRDTLRCAFKCSAQLRNGDWIPVSKEPLDSSKTSKKGTFNHLQLPVVFDTGKLITPISFEEVRANSNK